MNFDLEEQLVQCGTDGGEEEGRQRRFTIIESNLQDKTQVGTGLDPAFCKTSCPLLEVILYRVYYTKRVTEVLSTFCSFVTEVIILF